MRTQLELLRSLQTIDTAIKEIDNRILQFPIRMKRLEMECEQRQQKMGKAKAALEEIQTERRKKENQLRSEAERVEKSQHKLFSVKTNKEYQAALKEIEEIRQSNNNLETEILVCMEKGDKLFREVKEQEVQHQEWVQEFERAKQILQSEVEISDRELMKQQTLRRETIEKIDPAVVKRYERLIEKRQGLAVVSLRNGLCQGCNMNIPPQKFIEVCKNDDAIMGCPFCSRILYVEENG